MRIRHTTRYDDHTWAVSGISADMEQQRRERSLDQRLPTRADWWVFAWYTGVILVGAAVVIVLVGLIESLFR